MMRERAPGGRSAFAYEPSLDGIRAVAVVAVVAFHFVASVAPGAASSASTCSSCCRASSSRRCCSPSGRTTSASTCARSGPGGPAACSRRCSWCWSRSPSTRVRRRPDELDRIAGRRALVALLRRQLALHRRGQSYIGRSARRRRCATCGRWRSRSSSTWSGRWSWWPASTAGGAPLRPLVAGRDRHRGRVGGDHAPGLRPRGHEGRAYLATDTRAHPSSIGALLAMAWRTDGAPVGRPLGPVVGAGRRGRSSSPRCSSHPGQTSRFLYDGGSVVFAVRVAAVIAAVVSPRRRRSRSSSR